MSDMLALYKRSAFWLGAAAARDDESIKSVYQRIAKQLDAGVDPRNIKEIADWLARRRVMPTEGRV